MTLEIVTLQDSQSGALARILPGFGCNCYQFQIARGDRAIDLLWSVPNFTSGRERPSKSGIPILFPFPGRIRGARLNWEGRTYELEEGDGLGNAIHGFVHCRPWRVLEQSKQRLKAQFHAAQDAPEVLARWPADFRITAQYDLQGETLDAHYVMDNPGDRPLPFGFGTHPYFRVPLGGPHADDCLVQLPATRAWELKNLLPTGRVVEFPEAAALQAGAPFGQLQLDHVLTGLQRSDDHYHTEVRDPHSGLRLVQTCDSAFRECVAFTPPHREAICIEPLTCCPGSWDLVEQGVQAGIRKLKPGEAFEARVTIAVATSPRDQGL